MLRFSLLLTCSLLTSTLVEQHTACAMNPEEASLTTPPFMISFDSEKMTSARRKARAVLLHTFMEKYETQHKPKNMIEGSMGTVQEGNYNRGFHQAMGIFKDRITNPDIVSDLNNHIIDLLEGNAIDPNDHDYPSLAPTKGLWDNVKEALLKEGITFESLNVKHYLKN